MDYNEARKKARRDAAEILEEFSTGAIPVDPIAIANAMGVACYKTQLGSNVSGMIRKTAYGEPEIFVDIDDGPRRSRFTIAHELGHFAERMWRNDDAVGEFVDRRDGTSNVHEFYANEFAGSLLMPEASMRSLADLGFRESEIAQMMMVSEAAVRVRKQTLGL